ncbi:DUF1549 domain-containing protein, partial [Akkermansiaceae bacterium]|nr:DUF1549 domain-containing protein [Akkermansiaceae bacterium]
MLHFVSIFLCLTGSLALGFENSPTPQKQPPNGEHWAFKMPVANEGSIDRLINSKLTKVKLVAVPKAPREVLIRRIFHVITGLLPTPKEKARWIADTRANWLAHLTEDLLDRPS